MDVYSEENFSKLTSRLVKVKEIPDSVYVMVDAMYEGISGTDEKQAWATTSTTGGVE